MRAHFPGLTQTKNVTKYNIFHLVIIQTNINFNFHLIHRKQEPWRLPSRQAEFNGTNRLRLDVHSEDQAVTGNQGYFDG